MRNGSRDASCSLNCSSCFGAPLAVNAMRQNPNDWAMAKLLTVAKQHGMEVRSTGGSHHVFSHSSVKDPLSVPAHRPIKAIYIKRFVALIDQIED